MGKIIHPQKKEIKGPWLLSQDDFKSLNIVLENINNLLYQYWLSGVENIIKDENNEISDEELALAIEDKKKQRWNEAHKTHCEITSKDGIKLTDETILGLLKDKSLINLKPTAFRCNIQHGGIYENSFELKISNFYKGSLEYDIECSDAQTKNEIQYEIDNWIDKRKPNIALQFWSNYGFLIIFTFIVPLVMLAYNSFSTSYTTYDETLRLEMYELGQVGVNESNRDLALELILKSKSGYRPNDFELIEKPTNPLWIRLFVVAIFIYIISIFRPKTLLGLGLNKTKLNIYKFWIKFVMFTLPAVVIIGPFWKFIVKWLY